MNQVHFETGQKEIKKFLWSYQYTKPPARTENNVASAFLEYDGK